MADEDWGDDSSATKTVKPVNADENNNNATEKSEDSAKTGFRSFDRNNNNNNNTGFGNRDNNGGGFGGSRGGFGGGGSGGGGFGNRNNDGGSRSRQQSQEGGERKPFGGRGGDDNGQRKSFGDRGGFSGGERRGNFGNSNSGFGGRRDGDDGDRKPGFGGGFRPRQNDSEGGERRGGFGGGGFKRNDDEGGNSGGGGFNRRDNNGDGGERRGGGFGGGGRGGFGGNRDNNEEGGEKRNGFGGGSGFKRNDDDGGEKRGGFGGGGRGGFGGNRENNGDGGERRGGFGGGGRGGFGGSRDNNGDGGERRGGGFGGGGRGGFGGSRDNNEEGGEKRNGFGGGRGGFGGSRDNNGDGGERRGGGFGGGGRGGFGGSRDNDGGERRGGFGGGDRGGDRGAFKPRGEGNENGDQPEKEKERYIPEPIEENEETLFHTIPTGINFQKQAQIPAQLSGEDTESIKPIEKFDDAEFSENLQKNIRLTKYEIPTPVQRYAIPILLQRRDLMACAQTGSGKTAAYILPILKNILEDGIQSGELSSMQTPQALVLAPTRELAIQIVKECKKFSYGSIIKSNILYGGVVTGSQLRDINRGTNILVATPGRLLDVVSKGQISLEKIKYIVLDEADRMLDLGFEGPVREIMSKCTEKDKNIFMFSATFPKEIQKLAQDFLKKYLFLTIGVVGGANDCIEQTLYQTTHFEKREKLLEILNEIGNERIMIFLEKKKNADILALFLCQKNYPATSIHGDRLQSQREKALSDFTLGQAKIIVCTQVAARGLDINDVNHVINYDLPQTVDEYVHRIGRTGRCGNVGSAISFFDTESENDRKLARNLVRILEQAGKKVPEWLTSVAENAGILGTASDPSKCTSDIRGGFKSLALTSDKPTPAAAASADAGEGDEW